MKRTALAGMLGLAALTALPALAQGSGFVGHWIWNRTASHAIPGEPQPKSIELDITNADTAKVSWKINVTDPQGGTHPDSFEGLADNLPHPLDQAGGDTVTVSLAGGALKVVYAGPAGQNESRTCTLSADQRTMTCNGTLSDGHGHNASYMDVYQRG